MAESRKRPEEQGTARTRSVHHSTHETELQDNLRPGGQAAAATDKHLSQLLLIAPADNAELVAALRQHRSADLACERVTSFKEALDKLNAEMTDAVLVDFEISRTSGHAELEVLRRKHPYLAVVLLVPREAVAEAEALVTEGIDDFLVTDRDELPLLGRILRNACERRKLWRTIKQQHHFSSRLFTVVERTDNSVVITDLAGKVQWINDGFSRLSGYGMAEMSGRKPHRVLAGPGTDAAVLERIDEAIAAVRPLRFEIQYCDKQGRPYWVNCDLEPMRSEERIVGFMFMELDITSQKERERALQTSEERLQLALWGTEDGLWDWNLVDDSFFASTGWFTMLGLDPATDGSLTRGEQAKDLIHPEDRPRTRQAYRDHLQGVTGSFQQELRLRQKNGSYRWVLARGKVVSHGPAGAPLRMVGTIRDAHQQVIARQELQETKNAAEAASRVKTRFMTVLNHELRTPLNGIIGMNDLLMETELTEEQQDFLDTSQHSAHHLLHLISDLLDFSRLDAHHVQLNPAPFIVYDLVDDTVDTIKDAALEKDLELVSYIDPALPPIIRGDYERIRQIISNLLRNAVKFTTTGHIVLRLVGDSFNPEDAAMQLRIEVEDTGCGVTPEEAESIFELFGQSDGGIRRHHGGIGLGLATVRLLAEAMHGSCACSSVAGAGSTFTCTVRVEVQPADAIADAVSQELRGQHVLVACASDLTRDSLAAMIRSLGGEAIPAANRSQALAVLETPEQPLDVFLLENGMEGSDDIRTALDEHPGDSWITLVEIIPQHRLSNAAVGQGASVLVLPARRRQLVQALQGMSPIVLPTPQAADEARRGDDVPAVLVVEDDEVNRDVCLTMLKKLGCKGDSVTNGREAVLAVMRNHYDIVLMDIVMPVMDGIKATAAICDLLPAEKRPVIIALSAATNSADHDLCLSAGMADFLEKPLYKEDLANALAKWFSPFTGREDL